MPGTAQSLLLPKAHWQKDGSCYRASSEAETCLCKDRLWNTYAQSCAEAIKAIPVSWESKFTVIQKSSDFDSICTYLPAFNTRHVNLGKLESATTIQAEGLGLEDY